MRKNGLYSKLRRREEGLSFIELVIVVAVLGIITALAIPAYGGIQTAAKQAAVEATAENGLRLVAAQGAGINDREGSASQTPGTALDSVTNDTVGADFLDPSGAIVATPGEAICVWAYNKLEREEAGGYRYEALKGDCGGVTPPVDGAPGNQDPVYDDSYARFVYQCEADTQWIPSLADFSGEQKWSDGVELRDGAGRQLTAGVRYTVVYEGDYTSTLYPGEDAALAEALLATQSCLERVESWGTSPTTVSLAAGVVGAPKVEYVAEPPRSVRNLSMMFAQSGFNGDISSWDTSRVTNMHYMFFLASDFSQNLSGWNVSSVAGTPEAFGLNSGLTAEQLPRWNS